MAVDTVVFAEHIAKVVAGVGVVAVYTVVVVAAVYTVVVAAVYTVVVGVAAGVAAVYTAVVAVAASVYIDAAGVVDIVAVLVSRGLVVIIETGMGVVVDVAVMVAVGLAFLKRKHLFIGQINTTLVEVRRHRLILIDPCPKKNIPQGAYFQVQAVPCTLVIPVQCGAVHNLDPVSAHGQWPPLYILPPFQ